MTVQSSRRLAVLGAASSIGIRPYDGEIEAQHLDLSDAFATGTPVEMTAAAALDRLAHSGLAGFWIHVDADVLEPSVMPAVDSPEPGGPNIEELTALVRQLARHPRALGMQITIYDPALDPEQDCARRLVALLASSLGEGAPA